MYAGNIWNELGIRYLISDYGTARSSGISCDLEMSDPLAIFLG